MAGTVKDHRKLSRAELLAMLIKKTEENDALILRIEKLEEELRDRRLCIKNAGTLSEAALALSGVFEAADNAVRIYTDEILRIIKDSEAVREEIINEANTKAAEIISEAEEKAREIMLLQMKNTEFSVEQADIK
ncbi:MAG: hypothetical protein E7218_00740 [Anaerofustis stercorihominis]|nr:hypothetical protein [Anaerofustis stercorihominis]